MEGTYLNLFQHGPHHNEIWSNEDLVTRSEKLPSAAWITDYCWTPETVSGSESGRLARVWVHREALQKEN